MTPHDPDLVKQTNFSLIHIFNLKIQIFNIIINTYYITILIIKYYYYVNIAYQFYVGQ